MQNEVIIMNDPHKSQKQSEGNLFKKLSWFIHFATKMRNQFSNLNTSSRIDGTQNTEDEEK